MASQDLTIKSTITRLEVSRYVVDQIVIESKLEKSLRQKTSALPNGGMISSSDVGALLALLAQTVNAKKAIEVGTFTGYTALKIAGALPADGRLICCDINDEWASIGKPFWREAGLIHPSFAKRAVASVTGGLVRKQLGQLRETDLAKLDAAVRLWFGL